MSLLAAKKVTKPKVAKKAVAKKKTVAKSVAKSVNPMEIQVQKKVGLEEVMRRNGYNFEVSKDRKRIVCKHKTGGQCAFFPPSQEMRFNNVKVYLNQSITTNRRGQFFIATVDVEKTLKPLMAPWCLPTKSVRVPFTIAIDPGHGGTAKGAESVSQNQLEKNLTLATAFKLRDYLTKKGFHVILTRDKDIDMTLLERTKVANKAEASLFISLHYNATGDKNKEAVYGVETYLYTLAYHPSTGRKKLESDDRATYPANEHDLYSLRLAFEVQTSMLKHLGATDRGVRRARFGVLKNLQCPGILVEGGFLSHPQESHKVATDAYQYQLVQAIADGVLAYMQNTSIKSVQNLALRRK